MMPQRFESMFKRGADDHDDQETAQADAGPGQAGETQTATQTRVHQRTLTREEWRNLDRSQVTPGATYFEAGWRKNARETLTDIEATIDRLRTDRPQGSRSRTRSRLRTGMPSTQLPAGLRSRLVEALGPIAYIQLSYASKHHQVCRVGVRTDEGIEDRIVLVGPDTVASMDTVSEAVDQVIATRAPSELATSEPATSEPETSEPARASDPFGLVYEVEEIEGIGEAYTTALASEGILDTRELYHADPTEISEAIDVPPTIVARWQAMSELMAISGVGPQYAEVLARVGIRSIQDLAEADASELVERIEAKQDELEVRIQGNTIREERVAGWIRAAANHEA